MKKEIGNLLDMADQGHFDVIVHGCNCFHKMKSGIAKDIAQRYPQAEEVDLATERGSRGKLGTFTYTSASGRDGGKFLIVNAYTQYMWSGYYDVFEYGAFDKVLNRLVPFLNNIYENSSEVVRVGMPKIGCGKARGKEGRILPMMESFSKDVAPWCEVTLVTLS